MHEMLLALKSYLYACGWLLISILFVIIGYRLFDRFCPIDFSREIRQQNMAFALMIGLFLLGIAFGTLYLAAHVS